MNEIIYRQTDYILDNCRFGRLTVGSVKEMMADPRLYWKTAVILLSSYPIEKSVQDHLNAQKIPWLALVCDDVPGLSARAFTASMAWQIKNWVDALQNVHILHFCCDSGISRSSSLASSWLYRFGETMQARSLWASPFYQPNPHIFVTMGKALGLQLEGMVNELIDLNRTALADAIQKQL